MHQIARIEESNIHYQIKSEIRSDLSTGLLETYKIEKKMRDSQKLPWIAWRSLSSKLRPPWGPRSGRDRGTSWYHRSESWPDLWDRRPSSEPGEIGGGWDLGFSSTRNRNHSVWSAWRRDRLRSLGEERGGSSLSREISLLMPLSSSFSFFSFFLDLLRGKNEEVSEQKGTGGYLNWRDRTARLNFWEIFIYALHIWLIGYLITLKFFICILHD